MTTADHIAVIKEHRQTKKLVLGTQNALDKAIENYAAKGWDVVRTEIIARGITGRHTYIANLKREG